MVDYFREFDFGKYNVFVLEYEKDSLLSHHMVRPTSATYDEITDKSRFRTYTLEGAVISFTHDTSLSEIFMECAVRGIRIDFVEIVVPSDERKWGSPTKVQQIIDTHKDDISAYFDKIEAKRHYVALNRNKNDVLKYLVVDRFAQRNEVEFLNGDYERKAVLSAFRNQNDAISYCKEKNKEN